MTHSLNSGHGKELLSDTDETRHEQTWRDGIRGYEMFEPVPRGCTGQNTQRKKGATKWSLKWHEYVFCMLSIILISDITNN